MTWNVKAAVRGAAPDRDIRIAAEILEHDPDVLMLQDADDFDRADATLPAPIAVALRGRTIFTHAQYLIASRPPMRDCKIGQIPAGPETRGYVRCTITIGPTQVDLVTTHLVSPRSGLNAARHEWFEGGLDDWRENYAERLQQANTLLRSLAGHPRPLILAGDLNASEASPVIHTLKGIGLRDAFSSAGVGYGYTLGHALRTGFSFLRIDHILIGPTIGVRDCFVGGRDASQHRPVIADLLVRRG
jgi:endonuclease/exonuclease/phosphatase family metal-dependent hydrolase